MLSKSPTFTIRRNFNNEVRTAGYRKEMAKEMGVPLIVAF
jgi:hypothetical protein